MSVRIASFNLDEFFARPKVFSLPDWADGRPILAALCEFNALIQNPVYPTADRSRMVEHLLVWDIRRCENGVGHRNRVPDPAWAWRRANRGAFDVDHASTGIEILAVGRESWPGWVELAKAPTDEVSTR